jgi:hypothetical protein
MGVSEDFDSRGIRIKNEGSVVRIRSSKHQIAI